jgi:hypothetical protein
MNVSSENKKDIDMKTITKNVYSLKELLDLNKEGKIAYHAVQKVKDNIAQWFASNEIITEIVIETTWGAALEAVGFKDAKFQWSGFACQGDGASFTSNCEMDKLVTWFTQPVVPSESYEENNLLSWLAHELKGQVQNQDYKTIKDEFELNVIRMDSRYSHERTCSVMAKFHNEPSETDSVSLQFVQDVESLRLEICQAIYRDLNQEHDYLTSDEILIEFDETNEFQWDIQGNQE